MELQVSAYFALSTGVVGVLSCFFYSSTPILVVFLTSYIFSYWQLFRRLTQFKSVFGKRLVCVRPTHVDSQWPCLRKTYFLTLDENMVMEVLKWVRKRLCNLWYWRKRLGNTHWFSLVSIVFSSPLNDRGEMNTILTPTPENSRRQRRNYTDELAGMLSKCCWNQCPSATGIRRLTKYFDFYNSERPHQALENQTPQSVYKSASGGGAMSMRTANTYWQPNANDRHRRSYFMSWVSSCAVVARGSCDSCA